MVYYFRLARGRNADRGFKRFKKIGYFSENSCGFKPMFLWRMQRTRVLKYMFARISVAFSNNFYLLVSPKRSFDPIGIKINRFVIFENLPRTRKRRWKAFRKESCNYRESMIGRMTIQKIINTHRVRSVATCRRMERI